MNDPGVPDPQIAIRPFAISDAGAIAALVAEYAAEHGQAMDQEAVTTVVAAFAGSAHDLLLVAARAGTVVGYLAVHWIPFPMRGACEAYVSDLLVAAAARGAGVGQRLLAAVEAAARARGCDRLMLNNGRSATSFTRGFYPKNGFRERAEFANFVKTI